MRVAQSGEAFSALQPGCYHSLYQAVLCTAVMCGVSWFKTPELLTMLREGKTPEAMDGAPDDGRWSYHRCVAEWFSLLFLCSYHANMEHPAVMYWEQLIMLAHCSVGVFFTMVENDVFDDEMNSFGSISVRLATPRPAPRQRNRPR